MRKSFLIGAAVSVLLVLMTTPAFAAGWATPTPDPAGGYESPHGGYTTTSTKCRVCHAVHGATEGGEVLLRSTIADACTYCHVDQRVSSIIVYDGALANYSGTNLPNAHNTFTDGVTQAGVTCSFCHSVHAAESKMTSNTYLTSKILIKRPWYNIAADPDSESPTATGEPLATDSDKLALTKWCAETSGCHGTTLYWPNAMLKETHPVGESGTANANQSTSFGSSQYCTSCHSDTRVNSVETTGAFPHFTDGSRFLQASATDSGGTTGSVSAQDSTEDGVCLRCHRNGTGSGVGQTF